MVPQNQWEGKKKEKEQQKRGHIKEVVSIFAVDEIENSKLYSLPLNNVNGQLEKTINGQLINFHISDQISPFPRDQ